MAACPRCGQPNADEARFCSSCGARLEQGPLIEERRVVTVLFCDLVGSTAAAEGRDPEDVRQRMDRYFDRVQGVIERFGGTAEKFIGDAVEGVFGVPVIHEDDAGRAVSAGLRILQEIDALNASDPALALVVRIGINTGEVLARISGSADENQGMVTGDVVNTASRLQGVAPPGGIVAGELTYLATREAFDFEALDPVVVKGKAVPVSLWRVVAPRPTLPAPIQPAATQFVGREDELAILQATYRKVTREQSTQVVTVIGEPGAGKTRLIAEFARWLDQREEHVVVRRGRCLPYGDGVTFWALGQIVKAECGILDSDGPGDAERKLNETVEARVPEADRQWLRARLAPLVGLPSSEPGETSERFTAWRRFLESLATPGPFVCVIEDLQWADPALLDFIEHVIDWASEVPMFVVTSARLELFDRRPGWGGGARNASLVNLAPLSAAECAQLIAGIVGAPGLPAEVESSILSRVEGNPLFAEEFVRLLIERGALVRSGDQVDLRPDATLPVPNSIASVVSARLDTLPADRKGLLADAAVIGAVFWSASVAMVGGRDQAPVDNGLHDLSRQEFVRPIRASSIAGEAEFRFWHAIVRDVAYAQLPRRTRAERHRRAAQWIESVAPERVEDFAELLAYHYTSALELASAIGPPDLAAEVAGPALRYTKLAGDRAMGLDFGRAEAHYRRALELAEADSSAEREPTRAELLLRLGWTQLMAGDGAGARASLTEAVRRWQELGNARQAGLGLAMLGRAHFFMSGETDRAEESLHEAIRLLEHEGPSRELIRAHVWALPLRYASGQASEGLAQAAAAIEVDEALGGTEYRVQLDTSLGVLEAMSCIPTGADRVRAALASAEESGDVEAIARAHLNLMLSLYELSRYEEGIAAAEAGRLAMRRYGTMAYAWTMAGTQAEMQVQLGRFEEAIDLTGFVLSGEGGRISPAAVVWAGSALTRALLRLGRLDEARRSFDEVLGPARMMGGTSFLGRALATASELHEAAGDVPAARRMASGLLDVLLASTAVCEQARALPLVTRLLGKDAHQALLGAIHVEPVPAAFRPRLLEADALLRSDRAAMLDAAEGYAALGLRYDEARARMQGGDADGAATLVRALGASMPESWQPVSV